MALPAAMQLTIFFRLNDAGWSERYYHEVTAYTAMLPLAVSLIQKRAALSPPDVKLPYYRISATDVKGDSEGGPFLGGQGSYAGSSLSEPAFVALLLRHFASPKVKGRTFLRGIPDGLTVGPDFTPDAEWIAAFGAYQSELIANWALIGQANPAPAGKVLLPIQSTKIVRVVSRRVGRPFGLPVGRQRA